jgi:hypothetical protein
MYSPRSRAPSNLPLKGRSGTSGNRVRSFAGALAGDDDPAWFEWVSFAGVDDAALIDRFSFAGVDGTASLLADRLDVVRGDTALRVCRLLAVSTVRDVIVVREGCLVPDVSTLLDGLALFDL